MAFKENILTTSPISVSKLARGDYLYPTVQLYHKPYIKYIQYKGHLDNLNFKCDNDDVGVVWKNIYLCQGMKMIL